MKKSTYKSMTVMTVLLCLATLAVAWTSSWFSNWNMADWSKKWQDIFTEQPADPDKPVEPDKPAGNIIAYDNTGNPILAGSTVPLTNGLAFASTSAEQSITVIATVKPDSATNKNCIWTLSWQTPDTTKNVNEYIKITIDNENSCIVSISCLAGFLNNKIILTVITVDGGYSNTCDISFLGTPTNLTIEDSAFTKSNSGHFGGVGSVAPAQSCNELGLNRRYTMDLILNNSFNIVDISKYSDYSISIEGFGGYRYAINDPSVFLGYRWSSTILASSSINDFITTSVENHKLIINVKNYDYSHGHNIVMTEWVDSIYFKINVTNTNANISKSIYVRLVDSVTGVEIDKPNVDI